MSINEVSISNVVAFILHSIKLANKTTINQ